MAHYDALEFLTANRSADSAGGGASQFFSYAATAAGIMAPQRHAPVGSRQLSNT